MTSRKTGSDSRNDSENNRLSRRLQRYARVSTNMSGALTRYFVDRLLGREADHSQEAEVLTKILGNLKGPVMKVAQMLATIPDAVPEEYQLEFLSLQADAPSMGWPFVRRRMAAELGPDWQSQFGSFEREACSAASLGQVHRATSHDGAPLACKLQYPEMQSTVEADLAQLKLGLRLYESSLGGLKTQGILEEIQERLREELDYLREAHNIKLYGAIFASEPNICVPQVYDALTTRRLLVMEWLSGKKFRDVLDESQSVRNQIARDMFRAWYIPLYQWGVIHGDPHLGNYTFARDPSTQTYRINLLDYGCVRRFNPDFLVGVLELYHAMQTEDEERAVHAYEMWGFEGLNRETIDVLNLWARLLYDPILDNRVRPIQEDHSGKVGRETADKVHQELRRLGGIAPPREFVFMDRAAVGIGSVCLHLRAELNWHALFHEITAGFSPEHIREKQASEVFTYQS